ncbi:MAG: heparinase II/III family protein, partial [Chromatiales bacterium]|nr:heparinase II/III family protein [Chromatiales bacterium]
DRLVVHDSVEGHCREAVARYFLGPQVEVTADGCAGKLRLPGGESARWRATGADVRVVPSTWHPEFGLSVENRCIELWFTVAEVRLELEWG